MNQYIVHDPEEPSVPPVEEPTLADLWQTIEELEQQIEEGR